MCGVSGFFSFWEEGLAQAAAVTLVHRWQAWWVIGEYDVSRSSQHNTSAIHHQPVVSR